MSNNELKIIVPKGNYITESSTVDGPGFRDVLWTQGCRHHCKSCHNPETWDFNNGVEISIEDAYKALTKSSITHVTLSGGDPVEQSLPLYELVKMIKTNYPNKTVWIYSGYLFEDLLKDDNKKKLLSICDVLVDGEFIEEKRDETLKFRGSSNQRIIDLQRSLKYGDIIPWQETQFSILNQTI